MGAQWEDPGDVIAERDDADASLRVSGTDVKESSDAANKVEDGVAEVLLLDAARRVQDEVDIGWLAATL